jgi:hypothetical protein
VGARRSALHLPAFDAPGCRGPLAERNLPFELERHRAAKKAGAAVWHDGVVGAGVCLPPSPRSALRASSEVGGGRRAWRDGWGHPNGLRSARLSGTYGGPQKEKPGRIESSPVPTQGLPDGHTPGSAKLRLPQSWAKRI